uniref:Uncharacterized protein n=1 Tax=Arundo donax TaxID=35708 RepID=A0A0A8Y2D8_ARUDO
MGIGYLYLIRFLLTHAFRFLHQYTVCVTVNE